MQFSDTSKLYDRLMIIQKFNYRFFVFSILIIICCSSKMKNRQVKKIEYYTLNGKIESNKLDQILKEKLGLYKVEIFDTKGNLIREIGFDSDKNEDNVIERKFNDNNNLLEVLKFKKYSNQPLTKTYLSKYVYKNNLLVEILSYYGTFDSIGFRARNTISYNDKNQKIKDEFISYTEDANKETRIYNWKDEFSYIEDRIDNDGILAERHFVRLDNKGKEIEHHINFDLMSKDDYTFHVYFENTYDEFSNVLLKKSKNEYSPEQKTEYKYLYDRGIWIYCLENSDNYYSTTFRKIEYY